MKKVVDHVLENDDIEESKSEFASESKSGSSTPCQTEKQDKIVYDRKFLLSKSNLDDGLFKVAYTLNDSDKLYSDEEFPIRGVKTELINKVFKLTEINISEIKDLCFNEKPNPYTSRVQQRLNKKKGYSFGSGFQKKSNHNGNFKKKGLGFTPTEKQKNEKYVCDLKSKMTFVSGRSSEEEEKKDFWRQSNNEFLAKKQDEVKKMTEQKKDTKICFRRNIVGHIARDCSKEIQSKQGVFRKLKEKVVVFEPPIDKIKLYKDSTFEIGESSNKCYKKRAKSDNQKWVVKKVGESSSDDSDRSKSEELSSGDETDSIKSVEPQVVSKCEAVLKDEKSVPIVYDEDFPSLRAENYKKKIGKTEIYNQFYNDKHEFDAEKVFNPKVKHIFGKMIDRKVKGVKEFYEMKKKGKKPSAGDSVKPKASQAWVGIFFD
ncbi:putative transcription factor interactor and regulator CCHC(Zn) family [Helianthus annuus]|nr:putative transcription factor interactor and regulator CCHC(Zn) family [Helianthus annuus]